MSTGLQQQLGAGVQVLHLTSVASTQTRLRELVAAGSLHGPTLLVTDHQTAGRGTRSRSWISAPPEQGHGRPRDLALSYALPLERSGDPRLTLALGALLADAISAATGMQLSVKWPNDLLAGEPPRKVGGVLVEQTHGWLLVGVGINVNSAPEDFPAELTDKLTTLAVAGGRQQDVEGLQYAVGTALGRLPGLDIERWLTRFRALDRTAGTRYTVTVDGRPLEVMAVGVADSGELLLHDASGGEHRIAAFTELERL